MLCKTLLSVLLLILVVQIFFQGVVGSSRRSSVAIDDVNVTSDNCNLFPKKATPPDRIAPGKIFF